MPRAKKKTTTTKKTTTKKRVGRKAPRRVASDRRRGEDVFWNKVIEGFKKLLSPAFKRTGLNFRK
jgi:hypothetical protein